MSQNLDHISPSLRPLAVPIADLAPDPANVRTHNEHNLAAIVGSLRKYGQQKPVVVNADGVVIAGNGTLAGAIELEWSHLAVSRSELSGADATGYAIADNKTTDTSEFDPEGLARQLEALYGEDLDAALATGHTQLEIERMIAELHGEGIANDPDSTWVGMPTCDSEDQTAWGSVKVNFASAEDQKKFAELVGQTLTDKTRSIWYPPAEIGRTADKVYVADES